ncbi:DUF6894 family protein [Sphingomonas faeni]|uniref:DUF6894 family protein n=1 Tax=Sphingomonas faeni TaxID=185950 RepID=UPI000D3AD97F|nr:hypothetical protein [Sphingomonas faeni]
MQRYFVNLIEHGLRITDDDGFLASGLEVARQMAVAGAREMMAADILLGKLCLSTSIEILDQNRDVLEQLQFKDLIRVSGS